MRAALYARVSTAEQDPGHQLAPLRAFAAARGWSVRDGAEFVDHGYSGRKDSRPALNRMMADARARLIDVVVIVRLDRFARSLQHLTRAVTELGELGVGFVCTSQSIDTTTSTGKLLLGILGAFAEFEADVIRERTMAGLATARRRGKTLGRPRQDFPISDETLLARATAGEAVAAIARSLGIPRNRVRNRLKRLAPSGAGGFTA